MAEVTLSVEADSISKTRVDVSAGKHIFSIDESERIGGTDAGPNPLECMLGALAGCLNLVGYMVAKEMGFEIHSMQMRVEGNLDPLVYLGKKSGIRPGFKEIRVTVDIDSSASPDVLQQWAKAIEARCPVSDNLNNLTPIQITL